MSLGLDHTSRNQVDILANQVFRVTKEDTTSAICPKCGGRIDFFQSLGTYKAECSRCGALMFGDLDRPYRSYSA
jgi:uncharacterized paraquat-inducible protein A